MQDHSVYYVLVVYSLVVHTIYSSLYSTVKPPIKDTPKEDKPLNKGQTKCTNSVQNNLFKEDNPSTKDKPKMLGPKLKCVHI